MHWSCSLLFACFAVPAGAQVISFEDASSALDFEHVSYDAGGDGLGGACWFDYDEDGNLDLFLTNGKEHGNALFRGDGAGSFVEVTVAAGLGYDRGSSGVVAGDIDNDGYQDLFVTGDGGYLNTAPTPAVLYHNHGDGTFSDITAASGIAAGGASLSASFGDVNGDGLLDLFVSDPGPGGPATGGSHANRLYVNDGDLTFTDASVASGLAASHWTCASLLHDYDDDGDLDLFLGLCSASNGEFEVWRNDGGVTFTEVTDLVGLANEAGWWMGFSLADYDGDGDLDLFATNFGSQAWPSTLFEKDDSTDSYSPAAPSGAVVSRFGWGVSFHDMNNDRWPDLYFVGSLPPNVFQNGGRLLRNEGDGTFTNQSSALPVNLLSDYTSGVATGDYDADGYPDLVVVVDTYNGQPGEPVLLHSLGGDHGAVTFRLRGTASNRDGVGGRIRVRVGDVTQTREVSAGASFASMDSPWQTFGLGAALRTDRVEVAWPSGLVEVFANTGAGERRLLVEGDGCGRGASFCSSTPSSIGAPAVISSNGACHVADGAFALQAAPVPATSGLFFYSTTQVNGGAGMPLGNGVLCVGGPGSTVFRLDPVLAVHGVLSTAVDFASLPLGGEITAGSTWSFQAWFRDPAAGGALFDLSDGLSVTFAP